MRRTAGLALAAALILTAVLLPAGCGDPGPPEAASSRKPVRVSGSGTCLPLLRLLTSAYTKGHPELEFVYLPGLHSGGGVKGVAGADLELGAVSRELTDEEKALGLRYVNLSDDGLVLAVHPTVTGVENLTTEQVKGIYSGKYRDWSQLGGSKLAITVLDRNEDESAKMILRQYVLGDTKVSSRAVSMFYESDMVEALQTSPGSIGYFSLGYGLSADPEINVTYLKLDGVEASVDTIESGAYKMIRPLGVVLAKEPSSEISEFVAWASGPAGSALMRGKGFAPARAR